MNLPPPPDDLMYYGLSDNATNSLFEIVEAYGQQCAQHALEQSREALVMGLGPRSAAEHAVKSLMGEQVNCNRHPAAPHGYDRIGSLNAGRHMCTCEHWTPGEAS